MEAVESPRRKLTYTYVEAAELLGWHPKTISRMVAARKLKAVTVGTGSKKRIPLSELERLGGKGR